MKNKVAFGTDGIRGNAEKYPFTDDGLFFMGQAIAKWAIAKFQTEKPVVLIGADTRISGEKIKKTLAEGLMTFPITILDAGVIPTPAVCRLASLDKQINFGIVISASHNPYYDNGIKLFNAATCKLTSTDEKNIIENFELFTSEENFKKQDSMSQFKSIPNALETYEQSLKSFFTPGFLKGLKIVLDCANGATHKVAPIIFKDLGAEVITIANNPTGKNINDECGALHPDKLVKAVLETKAIAGFAFDGDGDRLTAVSSAGEVKTGDDVLAILMQLPQYQNATKIVGTVMSNQGLEEAVKKQNKEFIRTSVGDKHIAAKLEEEKLLLGGEPSGHTIMRDYLATGDGIFVALRVLEAMILNKNWEMESFEKFPQILINVPVANKRDLTQSPFKEIIKEQEERINGRILVRFSGTENLLRVMTEAKDLQEAKNIAETLANSLKELLSV